MRTARLVIATLDPRAPCAPMSWLLLLATPLWFAWAAHGLFGAEVGDRLIGALALFFVGAFPAGQRNLGRWPQRTESIPLPVGRTAGPAVELSTWLALAAALATGPVLILAHGVPWLQPPMPAAPLPWDGPGRALAGQGLALLLALPLAAAMFPEGKRRGLGTIARLLLPWLPLGVTAPAGWLAHPAGLGATFAAESLIAGALLGLRHTGWEDWRPRWPAWVDPPRGARPGLPGAARLAADLRAGLARGLAWALAFSLPAWALVHGACHGWLPEVCLVPGILLLATGGLAAVFTALSLPLGARMTPWWMFVAPPWEFFPLPRGAFARALSLHCALAWAAFALASAAGLAVITVGLPPTDPELLGVAVSLLMLLALLPPGLAWETAFATLTHLRRRWLMAIAILAGSVAGSVSVLPLIAFFRAVGGAAGGDGPLDLPAAACHVARVLGPAAIVGAFWLAVAHLLALRAMRR